MGIVFKTEGGTFQVELDGALDISHAQELQAALIEAFQSPLAIDVDVERVTNLDITIMQLLWAAQRRAQPAGVPFRVAGSWSPSAIAQFREAGIAPFQS